MTSNVTLLLKNKSLLKGLSTENDIEGYFIEKSVLIQQFDLKFRRMNSFLEITV